MVGDVRIVSTTVRWRRTRLVLESLSSFPYPIIIAGEVVAHFDYLFSGQLKAFLDGEAFRSCADADLHCYVPPVVTVVIWYRGTGDYRGSSKRMGLVGVYGYTGFRCHEFLRVGRWRARAHRVDFEGVPRLVRPWKR